MRIKRLDLSFAAEYGLKPKVMESLGQLVVLAGPNGAGKSRVLRAIKDHLSNSWRETASLEHIIDQVSFMERNIEPGSSITDPTVATWKRFLNDVRCVEIDGKFGTNHIFEFLPKLPGLADHRKKVEETWQRDEHALKGARGLESVADRTMSYLVCLARRAFSATHQHSAVNPSEKDEVLRDLNGLCVLVEQLLGASLGLNLDQQPTLFGRPIPDAKLSDGQSLLLQMAVGLHAQGSKLDEMVIILDEPECHLHPAVVTEIVEKLMQANPSGQIWIATHSVPLLAALPQESIWYMKDGEVSWAGRNPEIVLDGLLGGPGGREKVEEFLRLPAQFASNQFAAECLIPPKPANTGPDDPQAKQLRDFLEVTVAENTGKQLKILDFGAGHGRLLSAIHERWNGKGQFSDSISYLAFEPYPDKSGQLTRQVEAVYGVGSARDRVIERRDGLSMLDGNTVDIVVMCNVLHEIPPEEWKTLFGADGKVTRLLKPNGRVLVLEDMEIPHGEKAHRFGFLLLDRPHLFKLMSCREEERSELVTFDARSGRLRAHAISARLLGRTGSSETNDALRSLRETALNEIKEIRSKELGARDGRLHALWTQLLANATLALETLA